ncbi:TLC domain-containing protein 4-B [Octopus bimaculoides]|uniref:TLC domain-containing protein n=2 Tax=Octopus TaxID=6643 RepID=A0A0L8IA21_OCTBM|nr:TLC domain-containing protein 4-B [Octopus bimaculoides]|eukprot:XP_014783279.1 PREDICTED: transmembrane protein 56-B-like [Octopus bimaculoides]
MSETGVLDNSYMSLTVVSFLAFMFLYEYVSPWISCWLCPKYKTLTEKQQINWNTRVISSVHAVIMGSLCLYTINYDPEVRDDPIWRDTPQVRVSGAILIGYSLADSLVMALHYDKIGEIFYFLHHASAAYAFFYVAMFGVLPYFSNYRLLSEISTPLVNQRWFLSTLDYKKDSKPFIINGVIMTLMFFITRLACMPYYWYKVYEVYNTEPFTRLGHMQYVLIGTCFVLDVINFLWFYRMLRGVYNVLQYLIHRNDIPLKEE